MPKTSFLPGFERRTVNLTTEERNRFLNIFEFDSDIERYVWFAVEQAAQGHLDEQEKAPQCVVTLFLDEAEIAAQMAERIGMVDLAEKFRGVKP